MSVMEGCHGAKNRVEIVEMDCPRCGGVIELFVKEGLTVGDAKCETCGYEVSAGSPAEPSQQA